MATFRDFKVFFHFNHDIIDTLKEITQYLEKENFYGVKNAIVNLINKISLHFNETEGRSYEIISLADLENFNPPGSKSIDDIFTG